MKKKEVIQRFRRKFEEQLAQALRASESARAEATDAESRGDGKYDTRGLEASYLAAGQAERAEELIAAIGVFEAGVFRDFAPEEKIAAGALVEVEFGDGERSFFLLGPCGGGMTLEHEGSEITLLAPSAPVRKQLAGLTAGQSLKQPSIMIKAVY